MFPSCLRTHRLSLLIISGFLLGTCAGHAALLSYEPFTNAVGANLIGSSGGFGFSDVWQSNGSSGVATNTSYSLSYTDNSGHTLITDGGAGFFQGSTTANNSMQPIRLFSFSRGTNGTDATTTWISFLAVRQGPTVAGNNPYPRGANVPHDLNFGALQKLAIGNSSGAGSNTVGLIPQGSAANLKSSKVSFSATNFIVVRIDHNNGAANDNAYLFVNPNLAIEPSVSQADTNSLDAFDFSFDRLRVFAGGNASAAQPYAELVIDEYRLGETFTDVTPHESSAALTITNTSAAGNDLTLSGTGGPADGALLVLASTDLAMPFASWPIVASNHFDANGNFSITSSISDAANARFYRVRIAPSSVSQAPEITTQPADQAVIVGEPANFSVTANGTEPLRYQWFFNTNNVLEGQTNSALTITNAQFADAGFYSVLVTNATGGAISSFAQLTVSESVITNGAYFVSIAGSDSNPGTISRPFKTIGKGLTALGTGGWLYLRAGTYALSSKLSLNKTADPTNRIRVWAYPGETVVIDSTGNSSDGISISGTGYHLKGITVMKAGHNGINISGNSNLVELCTVHDNGNTGLHITGGTSGTAFPAHNLILNCDAFLNYDPPIGGNADGFSAKWNLGEGNVFSGCRAWWNSDDGWDLWMGTSSITISNCWAFYNGTNYWNDPDFAGNGQGFKLGGNYVGAPHRLVHSVAFKNTANGVDQNNNLAGQTVDNCTSWANANRNFNLNHGANTTPHIVRNNLSFAGGSGDSFTSGSLLTNNSWQVLSPPANASDVQSVDTSMVTAPRAPDGSLPDLPFLRPISNGRLVDQGVDIGESYSGAAPDLGAFESNP